MPSEIADAKLAGTLPYEKIFDITNRLSIN